MINMKAEWILEYDLYEDKNYNRPGCPRCMAPVLLREDGKYRCISCKQEYELDPDMIEWIKKRSEAQIRMEDCEIWEIEGTKYGCDGKGCVEAHYRRNPVTMNWQFAYSVCKKCGRKIIV